MQRRIESVCDLDVTYNSAFSFAEHIIRATNAASKQLGCLMRHSRGFRNLRAFKLLYDTLVRPFLEYASVLWSPHQAYLMGSLERVQHRFLRFASYRLGQPMRRFDHVYGSLLRRFNFLTMQAESSKCCVSCIRFDIILCTFLFNCFFFTTFRTFCK